jgi:catalase
MSPQKAGFVDDILRALEDVNGGVHHGLRPARAKGLLLSGLFTPLPGGQALTRAPHLHRTHTPVTVRLSDSAGIPSIPDNHPDAAPRGIAIRFHLAEHLHTDIIGHSVDGFPARNAAEFVEFLRAAYASGRGTPQPTPFESVLATHPAALRFVQTPKPVPTSFARESFYGVTAYRFTNIAGAATYGRYRMLPNGGTEYLNAATAAAQSPDFLFDELKRRIAKTTIVFRIQVQLAKDADVVDDSTTSWPDNRPHVEFGRIELTALKPDNQAEQRHIIFDPIPRLDGIEPSADPLLEPRAAVYLASGRRRRE